MRRAPVIKGFYILIHNTYYRGGELERRGGKASLTKLATKKVGCHTLRNKGRGKKGYQLEALLPLSENSARGSDSKACGRCGGR